MCSLCSRLRRGALYRVASELGATKIALGHHRDDMVQTLFMNMFFGGRLKGMPPKLVSDDGRHVVIRPLAYVAEADLERWADERAVPDHSVQPVRQPAEPAARSHRRRCCATGSARTRAGSTASSTRWRASCRRISWTGTCSRSPALQPTGVADADGDRAFDDDEPAPPAVGRAGPSPTARCAPAPCRRRRRVEEKRHDKDRRRAVRRRSRSPAAHRSTTSTPTSRASAAGRPAAAPRPMPSSGCRRSRRSRSRRRCSRTRRGRAIEGAGFVAAPPKAARADVTRAARRAHHRDRPLALRRPVLVRRLWCLAPAVRLRPLRPAVLGGRTGGRTAGAAGIGGYGLLQRRTTSARSRS